MPPIDLTSAAGAWAQSALSKMDNKGNAGYLAPQDKQELETSFQSLGRLQQEALRDLDELVAQNGSSPYHNTEVSTVKELKAMFQTDLGEPQGPSRFDRLTDAFEGAKGTVNGWIGRGQQTVVDVRDDVNRTAAQHREQQINGDDNK